MSEAEAIIGEVSSDDFPLDATFSGDELLRRTTAFEGIAEILMNVVAIGCYWPAEWHGRIWQECIECLASPAEGGVWESLRRYPGTLVLYTGGISAWKADNWEALRSLLLSPRISTRRKDEPQPCILRLQKWAAMEKNVGVDLPGMKSTRKTPVSDRIHDAVRPALRDQIPDEQRYSEIFDTFEYFMSLVHADHHPRQWAPAGRFQWRWVYSGVSPRESMAAAVEAEGTEWQPLRAGFFGGDPERFKLVKQEFDEYLDLDRVHW